MKIKCEQCGKTFEVDQGHYYYSPYLKCPFCGKNPTIKSEVENGNEI
jgi:Zn finger protein HypA/HybF involved in hydrogenase expression